MQEHQEHHEFENIEDLKANRLDDIVLGHKDKKEKIKKYSILGIASLFIFVAVVGMVKVLMGSSSVPRDKIIETTATPVESKKDDPLLVNEANAIADETEALLKEQKDLDEKKNEPNNSVVAKTDNDSIQKNEETNSSQTTPLIVATSSDTQQIIEPKPQPKESSHEKKTEQIQKKEEPAPSQKSQTDRKTVHKKEKTAPKKSSRPSVKVRPKPRKTATTAKKIPSVTTKKSKRSFDTKGKYVIQAGAFLRHNPDPNFLYRIRSLGMRYFIKEAKKGDKTIKRIYIGPFSTRQEAQKALQKVHRELTESAFITQIR